MKGVGTCTVSILSAIGKTIEDGANKQDAAAMHDQLDEYADYLEKVKVVYE